MTIVAIARPQYLLQERAWKQERQETRAFMDYLSAPEGQRIQEEGADALQMKRVLFKGQGVLWQGRIRKGCECPYRDGSYQAKAWWEGFQHRRWESELTYNTPRK